MGVENPEQVKRESAVVKVIDDDTDLKVAASFDINKFMKERGLDFQGEEDLDSLPPLILQ